MAKIVIELDIDGDAQRAYDVVNELLDMGEFQDRIGEFSADSGDGELEVVSATVQLNNGLRFFAQGEGDRTVGDGALQATIEIPEFCGDVEATRQTLEDAFRQIFDDRRARVLTEAQLEAQLAKLEQNETATDVVRCACGEWSGDRCDWSGERNQTVVVEFMPEQHRASNDAAGNRGVYPLNGARRIRVHHDCADHMVAHDSDWCEVLS